MIIDWVLRRRLIKEQKVSSHVLSWTEGFYESSLGDHENQKAGLSIALYLFAKNFVVNKTKPKILQKSFTKCLH
jgi:hypothetical protein